MDEDIKTWQNIVSELCAKAPDDKIRDCLRLYDASQPSQHLKTVFKRQSKDILHNTLIFLRAQNIENMKKPEMIECLIQKVKNLFPEVCRICNNEYCVKIEDEPFLACGSCEQEVHKECYSELFEEIAICNINNDQKVVTINNILSKIPGLYVLCKNCEQSMISQTQIKQHCSTSLSLETKKKENTSSSNNVKNPDHINVITISPGNDLTERAETSSTTVNVPNSDDCIDTPFRTRRCEVLQQRERDLNIPLSTHNDTIINVSRGPIKSQGETESGQIDEDNNSLKGFAKIKTCSFYQKGNCRFGLSGKKNGTCKFAHPKPCQKLLKHGTHPSLGCNKGKKCEKYHPKMCFESLKSRKCDNNSCKFVHVKGTNKKQGNDKHILSPVEVGKENLNELEKSGTINQSFLENALHCLLQTVESKFEARLSQITQKMDGLLSQQIAPNIRTIHQPMQTHLNQQLHSLPPQWNPYPLIRMPHPQPTMPINQYMENLH